MISIFPLQTILFQFLFLTIAIAIEGFVLRQQLYIGRKTSIDYAASINLLATIVGWVAFFLLLRFLPYQLKGQVISYIFFDRFLTSFSMPFNLVLVSIGVGIFLAAFLIKFIGLKLLQILLDVPRDTEPNIPQRNSSMIPGLSTRVNKTLSSNIKPNQAAAVLLGNACSHSAFLLILLLRASQLNSYY